VIANRQCFTRAPRIVALAAACAGLVLACYDTKAIALRVRTANIGDLDCVETADKVFDGEGFTATPSVSGTRFYSPRASANTAMVLAWGIAVTIGGPGKDERGPCTFDLQALSVDENCGINCRLTPQPGYNDVTRKMAGLLVEAFKVRGRADDPDDR